MCRRNQAKPIQPVARGVICIFLGDPKEHLHLVMVAKKRLVKHHARENRANRQYRKGHQHDLWAFMGVLMGVFVTTLRAKEGQEH